ncbi:hypothetical protein HNY73_006919 [Argiope bruennichi]|uniref:Uncharacterized protein n=1 Tax=Argiope bruennichi TaxID=94029 RepID=A0A8T0FDD9_ARGBR|nr:hypothetical protein HNY73_006919 [Argiope bruennichi]
MSTVWCSLEKLCIFTLNILCLYKKNSRNFSKFLSMYQIHLGSGIVYGSNPTFSESGTVQNTQHSRSSCNNSGN